MHHDPWALVVIELALVLIAAKLAGDLAVRLRQPAVLGELVAGLLLGNLSLVGVHALAPMAEDKSLALLAHLGVLLLLFQVGLESTLSDMLKVGWSALLVAVIGVALPFGLGWGVGALLEPGEASLTHAFLGAALCATSVGITARVLKDLGRSQSREARIILGAAVIDDVLGLMVLAMVSGIIVAANAGGSPSLWALGAVLGKAIGFLAGALLVGAAASRRLFRFAARLRSDGVLVAFGLSFCFALSWLADRIGLASIVGAFAAGLILEVPTREDFAARGRETLAELLTPVADFLVPVFFVIMGMRTDLAAFADLGVLGLAAALTVAAIVGKQLCGLGARGAGLDRLSIGIGMVPRGEVGLVFANVGLGLELNGHPVVSPPVFSAIVIMVIVTTLVTPPALRWSLARGERRAAARQTKSAPAPR